MKVTTFAKIITLDEGLKKSQSQAQIMETLKLSNKRLGGKLYKEIKALPEPTNQG